MAWIQTIPYEQADPKLKRLYDRIKGPDGNIDNVLSIHSLRPHSLAGHLTLYKNVLHNSNNTLPKWYLETLGVYVSHLNQCSYCVEHHFAGLKKLLMDDQRANQIHEAIISSKLEDCFSGRYLSALQYASKLTLDHHNMNKEDIVRLKQAGFTEGEILEVNQVVSYFNYVNRTVLGLGVNTAGDILGLSPNDSGDPKNWSHR